MRIGVVLPQLPTYSETFLSTMMKGLTSNGFDIVVFTNRSSNGNSGYKVVTSYGFSRIKALMAIRTILTLIWLYITNYKITSRYLSLLKSDNIQGKQAIKNLYINGHILSRSVDWLYFGFATMAIGREQVAKAIGAQMAVSIRGYDIAISPLGKIEYYNLTWKYLDKLHYLSKDLLNKAYNLGLDNQKKMVQITPAIEIKKFHFDRKDYNIDKDLKILTVARLHWKKGLNYALYAMKLLLSKGVKFKYTIVGEGDEYEKLSFMIHDLDLEEHVVLVGSKSSGEIVEIMRDHRIFLMPSVQEGFCNAVLEAQASGLLCIVSNAEGLSENVIHKKTGWVVKKRKPDAIAKAISRITSLPRSEIEKISKNAQVRISEQFNLSNNINKWILFFNEH